MPGGCGLVKEVKVCNIGRAFSIGAPRRSTPFAGAQPAKLSRHDAGWLVFQGVLVLPVSWALMSWGTEHLLAAETMLVMLLETMLGPLWVYMALGEEPSAAALVGGAVLLAVIAADGWVTLRDERRSAYKALSQ